MGRPRATEPRRRLTLHIPQSIVASVERELASGALGRRTKRGDLSAVVTVLFLRWLAAHEDITAAELADL